MHILPLTLAVTPSPRPTSLGKPKPEYERLKKDHWAWQPLGNPQAPTVRDAAWPKNDIDRFILAKLESKA